MWQCGAQPGWQVEGWVIVDNQWMWLDVFPLQNSTVRSSVPLIGRAALHIRNVLLCRREPLERRQSPCIWSLLSLPSSLCISGCTSMVACSPAFLSIGFVRGSFAWQLCSGEGGGVWQVEGTVSKTEACKEQKRWQGWKEEKNPAKR